jgi:hypothetical protein
VAAPSIFLAPRGANDLRRPDAAPNAVHRLIEASTIAAAELSGVWPDPATATALAQVVDALTDDGEIFAIGAMISRPSGSSMRVAVRRLDPAGMHAVLRAAGLRRQADVIASIADASRAQVQDVAFEIGPGAEARVGLELSPDHGWRRARTDGWAELLEEVVALEVADPVRADSVVALVQPDPQVGPIWGLAHVKLGVDESGLLPVAKLYVGIEHGTHP